MSRLSRLLALMGVLAVFCLPATAPAAETPIADLVEAWMKSGHADYHSPSFTHWNAEGEVPKACAACHSQPGLLDFLGADGSAAGTVDAPAAISAVIGCASCHSSQAHALTSVRFPSGTTIDGLDGSATCTVCHQGRQSGAAVTKAVGALGEDEVSSELSFINVHYSVAAATMHGAETGGGYQYPGKSYAGRFFHVPNANTCIACHDAHTTAVAKDDCMSCHRGVDTFAAIRMRHGDFDGDGGIEEGVHGEIETLKEKLVQSIQTYGREVAGTLIGYHPERHPYFFVDANGDGTIGDDEATGANQYKAWTPRLLKAAYNYQFVKKDTGAYVHNPAYAMQLLHDSLESLADATGSGTEALVRP